MSILQKIIDSLESVKDPEIPVISILDLGIVRKIILITQNTVINIAIENIDEYLAKANNLEIATIQKIELAITPTYSGCPAMNMIAAQIHVAMLAIGFPNATITNILQPAWTTDWLGEKAKTQLKAYGIAPPVAEARLQKMLFETPSVTCPFCDSVHTEMLAEFGSTSCKSLYRCKSCLEPFDYFKCH